MEENKARIPRMNDVELHHEIFKLLPEIITGLIRHEKMIDLLMANRTHVEQSLFDSVLEHRHHVTTFKKYYQRLYDECVIILERAGIDPYKMSAQEEKEFNNEFPDPYRWRVPAWLRKPIIKFFKS
ncbi:MAG: hypothetical protein R6V86_05135 [Spirochaetia bacterium]